MPNGKPGDHPVSDIVAHRLHLFGGGVDEEILGIVSEFGDHGVERLNAFIASSTFGAAMSAIQEQQLLLKDMLVDIWNELILERRRVDNDRTANDM